MADPTLASYTSDHATVPGLPSESTVLALKLIRVIARVLDRSPDIAATDLEATLLAATVSVDPTALVP